MRTTTALSVAVVLGCVSAVGCGGGASMVVRPLPDTPRAISELKRGWADAVVGDYPVMSHTARESMGTLEVVGPQFESGLYGIAVAKSAPALKASVTAALRKVMEDGAYMEVLRNWAIHIGKVDPPADPGAVTPPEQIVQLEDGKLHVGIEMSFPPMEFWDELKNPAGADVELARALAQAMGVELELVDMEFDSLIKAVESGQVDVAISSITITPDRAAKVDFVPYLEAGSGILVIMGNPKRIQGPEDLCDKTVAVQEGTSQVSALKNIRCP